MITERATAPMYLQMDLLESELSPDVFGTKFDVILVDPPWEEYARRAPGVGDTLDTWNWKEIENLKIEASARFVLCPVKFGTFGICMRKDRVRSTRRGRVGKYL